MGFTTRLFRRGWQHADPRKRRQAIEEVRDVEILKQIAANDPEASLRRLALRRIPDDQFILGRCAIEKDEKLLTQAVRILQNPQSVVTIATDARIPLDVRQVAVERMTDQEMLERLAMQDASKQIRLAATKKVNRRGCLEYIADKDRSQDVRDLATNRLNGSTIAVTRAIHRNRDGS